MNHQTYRTALLAAAAALTSTLAVAADPAATSEQVVVPQVDRRDIARPKLPSNDFEIGAFVGTYSTQNFGASAVEGLRLGYHVTEDFFAEAVYAQTKVSDATFRQVLPGGIFPTEKVTLSYYNLSIGYNVLPGEAFIGSKLARPTEFYLIGGVGSTKFDAQRRPTFNVGAGLRLFPTDRIAVQLDARDHIYSIDLLGQRQSTQNLELTGGLTFFF
jgi:outer membrane beta-barrel protein